MCNPEEVHHHGIEKHVTILEVMRRMHKLIDSGFLERIVINNHSFYKTTARYRAIKKKT
jgi:hypothetical protein